ncbi:MAG: FkbM family methyltransferase [Sphingomonas bacterium]
MTIEPPLAFDVGLNNGDDSDYYLKKGYRVIGIDANPSMCHLCKYRFKREVELGLMTVLNFGVSDHKSRGQFSINVEKPAISTFEPRRFDHEEWAPKKWEVIDVDILPISAIVQEYGLPELMKIDVEFYDHLVLSDLRAHGMIPDYITSEVHERACFDQIVEMGYGRFRLMPGNTVADRFGAAEIIRLNGTRTHHSFSLDASGPFGDDFPDEWMRADEALEQLLAHGLGWIDVHATH